MKIVGVTGFLIFTFFEVCGLFLGVIGRVKFFWVYR